MNSDPISYPLFRLSSFPNFNKVATAREYWNRAVRSDPTFEGGQRSAKAWGCIGRSAQRIPTRQLDTSAHPCGDSDASVLDVGVGPGATGPGADPGSTTEAGPSYRPCTCTFRSRKKPCSGKDRGELRLLPPPGQYVYLAGIPDSTGRTGWPEPGW